MPLEVLTAQQQAAEEEERVLIALKKKSGGLAKKKRDAAHLAGDLVRRGVDRPGRARLHGKPSEEAVILGGQMQQRQQSLLEKKGCRRSLHVDQLLPTGTRDLDKVPERAEFGEGDAGAAAHKQARARRPRSIAWHMPPLAVHTRRSRGRRLRVSWTTT